MSNPELTHHSPNESHAILSALRGQQIERLESENMRLNLINKSLQDENDRLTTVLAYAPEEGTKDQHIRTQARTIVSLRRQLNELKAGRQVAQEWHDEPGEEREDLP